MTTTWVVSALAVLITSTHALPAGSRKDTWSLPLSEKERVIEATIRERHNILGLYPSQVEVPLDGSPVDNTTLGIGNIAHAVCWTANYLAGASYRYAFLKREGAPEQQVADAKARVDELFEAVYRCQLVTGVRGLQARGYAIGHGESYEERWGSKHSDDWHQGAGEYRDLRWRGSPSHHNYSDSIHGLGAYYDLAAEGEQKERCREAIDALVSYWVDNDLKIQPLDANAPAVPILGVTDGRTPNTRIMMAVAGAKVAHHATGKAKFKECYDRLVKQYGLRGRNTFSRDTARRGGHDDSEHVFGHLDNLFRIEKDEELLAFYRAVADTLWANHKGDAQSLFTYIYLSINPDSPDREKALADALRTLRSWPTDMTLFPVMNSLRDNIGKVGDMAEEPLPMNEAAWDNEYIFKGHLYRLDGWLSRPIVSLTVATDDPYVMYACDAAGDIYQSRDNAASWRCISDGVPAPARQLASLGKVRALAAATDGGVYLTTTGGHSWRRLDLPADSGRPLEIKPDPSNPFVLYVVTDRGVYRSKDFGEKWFGAEWDCLSEGLPRGASTTYAVGVAADGPALVYAILEGTVYTKSADATEWTKGTDLGSMEYAERYPWLIVAPSDPNVAYTGYKTSELGGVRSLLTRTTDGGVTWTIDVPTVMREYAEGRIMAIIQRFLPRVRDGELNQLAIDPRDADVLYAATKRGVLKSTNGGDTWTLHAEGLDISFATNVMAPAGADSIFLGTYAGLYRSTDGGETWDYANLRCQFQKNTVREIGGAAYIDAYWLGRYHGFIDDETANAPAEGWE